MLHVHIYLYKNQDYNIVTADTRSAIFARGLSPDQTTDSHRVCHAPDAYRVKYWNKKGTATLKPSIPWFEPLHIHHQCVDAHGLIYLKHVV